jgi:hypothetical protein
MDYKAMSELIQLRANQAREAESAAKKLKPAKRQEALRKAWKMAAACEVAATILGEGGTDAEERIKAVLYEGFFA